MARNWMKSLAAAAMLASAVPTWAQTPDIGTSAQISEVLANDENKDNGNTIFLDDVLIKSQIEEQMNEIIKDKKLSKLMDFYWEEELKRRINEMIDEIYKSPDIYWRFDTNWNFSIVNNNWSLIFEKQWESLYESKLSEYCKYKGANDLQIFTTCWMLLYLVARVVESRRKDKLKKENETLRDKLRGS